MKIIHMADSHLGFSSHNRVDKFGRNLFEEMIYKGFEDAVDRIIELKPDAIIHAGDVFHHVRPRIRTLYILKRCLEKLHEAGVPIIIISGNHDAPKSSTSTSPFVIFEGAPDLYIAHKARYERFEVGDRFFHCIPFCLEPRDYFTEFEKIERNDQDVLILHGLVEALSSKKLRTVGEHEIKDSILKSDFDYIALGHYHGQVSISKNAWYSGSIEYFNFGESEDKKGILFVDLDNYEVQNVSIRPKYMVNYQPIDCIGLSSTEIKDRLMEICDRDAILNKIVRVNLKNVNRIAFKNIDQASLNRLRAMALHLDVKVDFQDDQYRRVEPIDKSKLHEEFAEFLEEEGVRERIPQTIKDDVIDYGSNVLKKAVTIDNTEALNASQ
ncbi:MAG: exonuclease SbcCD subunit D [Methanotrichaceae archaeon]|nr:exonuclease SbcCD subunit D [Methanotrichaceae archaeon]